MYTVKGRKFKHKLKMPEKAMMVRKRGTYPTYSEIVFVEDGFYYCNKEITRRNLVRRGWEEVSSSGAESKPKTQPKDKAKKTKKKESLLDKAKKIVKGK